MGVIIAGKLYSGKADLIHISGKHALIIDWKTSRGEVESAEKNPQLRALAVLAWRRLGVESVTAAIIQPWASPQVSVCRYLPSDLKAADREIAESVLRAFEPNAPRIPGERQCKYCRALSVCPEAKAVVQEVAVIPRAPSDLVFTAEQCLRHWDLCLLAKRVIAAEEENIKAILLENPDSIPGLRLKPGAVKSTITDVRPIYRRLQDYGVKPEEFAAIVKTTKKDLTALVKAKTGTKGRDLDDCMEGILQGCTEEKQNAPSLERVTI